ASSTPEPRPAHAADAREAPQHGDAAPQEHEVSDGSVAKASAASLPQKNVAKQPRKRPAPKTLAPLTEKIGAYYGVKPAWEVAEMFGVSAATARAAMDRYRAHHGIPVGKRPKSSRRKKVPASVEEEIRAKLGTGVSAEKV